ncbi:chitin binding peritrophin-A domain-containing protein [Streptomyces sp. NPDC048650]|uniref:chitin binding peritrophin-A domain-containing protein n=1 Tax=Streptomyces sp. NPDC048650 TaxID=3365583 RepID=UPI0037116A04
MQKTTTAALTLLLAFVPAAGALADDASPRARCSTDKLMPYPGHADKFIQCSNGVPYVMPCPEGLEFNYPEQVCDWPSPAVPPHRG